MVKEFGFWALDQDAVTEDLASKSQQPIDYSDVENVEHEAEHQNTPVDSNIDQAPACGLGMEANSLQETSFQQNLPTAGSCGEQPVEEALCLQESDHRRGEEKGSLQRKAGWGSISNLWHGRSSNTAATQQGNSEVGKPVIMQREPAGQAQDLGHICSNGKLQGPHTQ